MVSSRLGIMLEKELKDVGNQSIKTRNILVIPTGLSYVNGSVVVVKGGKTMEDATTHIRSILAVNLGDVAYDDEIKIIYPLRSIRGLKAGLWRTLLR